MGPGVTGADVGIAETGTVEGERVGLGVISADVGENVMIGSLVGASQTYG